MGNIVRRVLHLIREESEQEDEDALESERSMELESPSPAAASDQGEQFAAETPSAPSGASLPIVRRAPILYQRLLSSVLPTSITTLLDKSD